MSFSPGEEVVIRGQLGIVVDTKTVAGQDFVGCVPLQAVQWVPAGILNQEGQYAGGGAQPQAQPQAQPPAPPKPAPKH